MYNYQKEKESLFTEQGFETLSKVRDKAKALIESSGSFMAGKAFAGGDCWQSMAALDYLLEKGEIREVQRECAWRHKIFIGT